MVRVSLIAALVAAGVLSGCVSSPLPPTTVVLVSVEEQKKEIARLRDEGRISYEEAARRQFAIQRNSHALTDGELDFWRQSILYAQQVDRRQITPVEYRRLVQIAYQRYVPPAQRRA